MVARSEFVGREAELHELTAAIDRARAGRGGAFLIGGEPGIGKSRLLEEAARAAADREVPAFWGACRETGGAPAYFPWVQVLRGLQRRRGEPLPPALARLIPGAGGAEPGAGDRFLLHDAVVTALLDAAPALVLLEDLHAADPDSLELLELLVAQVRGAGLVVAGTLRDSTAPAPELSQSLAAIARDSVSLSLGRLRDADVQALLSDLPAPARRRAAAVAEGHPLYLTELGRWMSAHGDTGDALPLTLRAAIEERLADLEPPSRALLQLASVLGREVELPLLRAMADGLPLAALEPARSAQIVTDAAPGAIRFSHVLVREALHTSLPVAEREVLHRRAADALEAAGGERWAEIAHHLLQAGPDCRDRAAAALELAAELALRQLACADAVEALERALGVTADPAVRVRRQVALGKAQIAAGEGSRGQATCLEAAGAARQLGDPELFADAALAYGEVLTPGETDLRLVSLLEEARAGLTGGPRKALVLARLAAALQPAPDPAVPIVLAREAIAMARQLGDEPTLLAAVQTGVSALMDLADPAERRALNQETVALARKLRDPAAELRGLQRLVLDGVELADPGAVEHALAGCEAIAARMPPYHAWRLAGLRAMWAGHRGDLPRFHAELARARELAAAAGEQRASFTLDLGELYMMWKLGRDDEVERLLPVRATSGPSSTMLRPLIVAAWSGQSLPPALTSYLLGLGDPSGHELLTQGAVASRDLDLARKLRVAMLPLADRFVSGGIVGFYTGYPMEWSLARISSLLGDHADARERLERARALALQAGAVPQGIRIARDLAASLRRHGETARAAELEADADRDAAALGLRAPAAAAPELAPAFRLEREGETWALSSGGETCRLRDSKGLRLLARLVAEPGRDFHVLDLEGATQVDAGDAGELIDERARDAYRRRLRDLREDMEEAEVMGDAGRAARARGEIEALEAELSRALGLGGRQRRTGSAAERARINVQRRLRDAIERISEQHAAVGKHLDRSVRTGVICRYEP